MIVVVTGSRTYHDRSAMFAVLDKAHSRNVIRKLVLGDAKGADTLAKEWAIANDVPFIVFKADWDKHGRSAGVKRNAQMVEYALDKQGSLNTESPDADLMLHRIYVVAFTDKPLNDSRGTANCVAYAQRRTTATIVHFMTRYGESTRTVIQDLPR